ncbi:type I-G CRISPR-associated RAMP protein Csb1/Cas7g [Geoalkalibacter halelectricus]|uniref:Type I-U CRISPR-associated RAMP protein Csb1/Cas7u n=1 Tax=Geoalkalibacter halelectricus TaxID=2847045 RepID=A0ABY5ZQ06_9BACT|nr:type I-U CRISPR-associated RAMP protein Csb1/Cas7u [Geoalkalibacter halelectricus]MDO3377549.1 type I-U CRISPR-associated RAMP protein Csb1/Cas7u [Geoalkalibacter halelectricus]UWZ80693.1 type I-U CRISPR-associated RAMP protein Csb1/Cas7u [Geoalkalibacter halelectricus]
MEKLTLEVLKQAVSGTAAAFRCVTEYQPAGGVGDKVFPPTYEGGKYAVEKRMIGGQPVPCVLLDSVQSQANRMELALLEAKKAGFIYLPLVTVRFEGENLGKAFVVTSLDAPHRIADAILRDSLLDGVMFRRSELGRVLDNADTRNATGLFGLNPTALVFGIWDSTGPRGGLGAKFQRALVSEMVGVNAEMGCKTASRIDPAQIMLGSGPIFKRNRQGDNTPHWTLDQSQAAQEKNQPKKLGKDGKPSEANHGNVTPGIVDGGFTISYAQQTTVLSLAALRRLRFPLNGSADSDRTVDQIAHVTLAALGLTAATLAREEGADLRSRCQLFPTQKFVWELLDTPGEAPRQFELSGGDAVALLKQVVSEAKNAKLPWYDEINLLPTPDLMQLVTRSQELAMNQAVEGGE